MAKFEITAMHDVSYSGHFVVEADSIEAAKDMIRDAWCQNFIELFEDEESFSIDGQEFDRDWELEEVCDGIYEVA